MKKLLAFVVFCCSSYCFGQQNFLFARKNLTQVRIYEDSINSKPLGFLKTNVGEGYFPTAKEKKDYFPLSFIRTNDFFFQSCMFNIFIMNWIHRFYLLVMIGI